MALDQSALLELLDALNAADPGDVVRQALERVSQALIDAEAAARIGAELHQRTPGRVAQRNGYRDRVLTTSAGDLELRIPKLRTGSFFPSLLERRRRIDQALFAVVMEAYVTGTSTRRVDDLVAALGADSGISKSEVSRICADLGVEVTAFRDRSLAGMALPYVFVDATFGKARTGGDRRGRGNRVTAQAVAVAAGISAGGRREVPGFDAGDSESRVFWTGFLRPLKARGPHGVQLVTPDAYTGLKEAIGSTLLGTTWQRCRAHALRNLLTRVPKGHADMAAAAVRTIFAQPDAASVRAQPGTIAGMPGRQFRKVEAMLRGAAGELTAFADSPAEHWRKIWPTNGLERVNKEIKRRTDVVGVFPNPPALLRLAGAVLAEIHDEWQVSDRRTFSEASMAKLLTPPSHTSEQTAVATPAAIAS